MVSLNLLLTASLAALAAANPIAVDKRQSGSTTCGSNTYSASQLRSAMNEGCNLHQAGEAIGNNNYPHTFNNREGLPFETSGPYQEFPILTGGVYTGGKSVVFVNVGNRMLIATRFAWCRPCRVQHFWWRVHLCWGYHSYRGIW